MNNAKLVLSPSKVSTFDLLPVAKKKIHIYISEQKLTAFCGCQDQIGAWDRHGSCTHYSTTLGHKKQAKQLQKCGWWMDGIALLLAQNVKCKKHKTTGRPDAVGGGGTRIGKMKEINK